MLKIATIALLILFFCGCIDDGVQNNGLKTVHFKGTDIVMQTIEYKNGKKNGYFTEYFRDGKIKAKQFFVDNELDDTSKMYHSNGQLTWLLERV